VSRLPSQSDSADRYSLQLKGRIITSFIEGGSYLFLEYSHNVWNKLDGDPRGSSIGRKFDGKLSGDIEFPFSFPFPTELNLESRAATKGKRASRPPVVTPTPQTFLERNLKANIEYELVLTISHGILRTNSKYVANFNSSLSYLFSLLQNQSTCNLHTAYSS
jgi:hypothetical protein